MSVPAWWWFASPLAIAYTAIGVHRAAGAIRRRAQRLAAAPEAQPAPPRAAAEPRRRGAPRP